MNRQQKGVCKMELVRLKASDYEETIDFLDFVFSKAHRPHSFAEILPIIYRPTEKHMSCNFAVKENDRIRAVVGLFPAEMKVGEMTLKLGGIGGVSAHPRDKGKGWMKLLMGAVREEMEQTGVDIGWLAGLRQRYQYFGYEKTGNMMEYLVDQTNLRHAFKENAETGLRMVQIKETDMAYIRKAKELHDRQPVCCVRSLEDFWLYATAVCTVPWAAVDENGEMVGYLVSSKQQDCVTELFAENDETLIAMIHAWMVQQCVEETKILLAPWQEGAARGLGKIAEEFRMVDSGNFHIFNWEKVTGSLMHVKNQMEPMESGCLRLGITGYGTLQMTVENGKAGCMKTQEEADVMLDHHTAARILFGNCPAHLAAELPVNAAAILNKWCPLPLCWQVQNHV